MEEGGEHLLLLLRCGKVDRDGGSISCSLTRATMYPGSRPLLLLPVLLLLLPMLLLLLIVLLLAVHCWLLLLLL